MTSLDWNSTSSRVGLVFRGRDAGSRTFLGSCFCLVEPSLFVTAAHCVRNVPFEELWLNHHGGPTPHLFTRVERVELDPETDIAVLRTAAPGAKWVQPFAAAQFVVNLGSRVGSFGYPNQAVSFTESSQETGRIFRGHVQRPFLHASALLKGGSYRAYELSFPCPNGLSGAPVFLEDEPTTIVGVVTEDLEVGTLLNEQVVDVDGGQVSKIEIRRVIQYGVAESIFDAVDAIERVLGRPLPRTSAA